MLTVTPRAIEVLRRGLEAARLDPQTYGIRVRVVGGAVRMGFDENATEGEETTDAGGVRIFVDPALGRSSAIIDVSSEHETLIVR